MTLSPVGERMHRRTKTQMVAHGVTHGVVHDVVNGVAQIVLQGVAHDVAHGVAQSVAHGVAHGDAEASLGGTRNREVFTSRPADTNPLQKVRSR